MFVVGLTGGIGSGKTTVANLFAAQGIELVDTDQLAHDVVAKGEPALTAIAEHFGTDALLPDGNLNRAALRTKVFNQPNERQWLEGLIHPLVRQRLLQGLKNPRSDYVILVSPLLLETDQHLLTDHIVVIDVPEAVQISRTVARDKTDPAGVKAIINTQISRQDRLAKADTIIDNTQPVEKLTAEVKRLDKVFRNLAQSID